MKKVLIATSMIVVTVFAVALPSSAESRKPRRIARGDWGAAHVHLEVGDGSATIEFDCAHAQVDGPLVIDRRGRFNLKGTFTRESPGPIRVNAPPVSEPARFTGSTDGKHMTLTITLINRKETIGTYSLTLGGQGRVFKCR